MIRRYIIDEVRFLSSLSLVLHIPMAHRDDRNQVKGFVAKNNTTFKLKHIKVLVETSVIKVTACRNGSICIEGGRISYLTPVCVANQRLPEPRAFVYYRIILWLNNDTTYYGDSNINGNFSRALSKQFRAGWWSGELKIGVLGRGNQLG